MNDTNTRKKIIDAGIRLFAENGYHNTSIREITRTAETNIASINYHFGSKSNLAKSILCKIMEPLNSLRLESLDKYLRDSDKTKTQPHTKKIISIFIKPALEAIAIQEEGFLKHQFITRTMTAGEHELKIFFKKMMEPVFSAFLNALVKANPEISEKEMATKLTLSIGAMHHAVLLLNGQFAMDKEYMKGMDHMETMDILIDYITKGIESK